MTISVVIASVFLAIVPSGLTLAGQAVPSNGEDVLLERLTEDSRRALFFARFAVSQHGGTQLRNEHLLLGILQAVPTAVLQAIPPGGSVAHIQERVLSSLPPATKVETSTEIPIAAECQSTLEAAAKQAELLGDRETRPEHLLLALLADDSGTVGKLLRDIGMSREPLLTALNPSRERR